MRKHSTLQNRYFHRDADRGPAVNRGVDVPSIADGPAALAHHPVLVTGPVVLALVRRQPPKALRAVPGAFPRFLAPEWFATFHAFYQLAGQDTCIESGVGRDYPIQLAHTNPAGPSCISRVGKYTYAPALETHHV